MIELPDTLIHFYRNPDGPFRSISEVPESDWSSVMNGMSKENTWYEERFDAPIRAEYMEKRLLVEERLHRDFIAMGGIPKRRHPYYAVLCDPDSGRKMYPDARQVVIPLTSVPTELITFTHIDSMVSYGLLMYREALPRYDHLELLPCHGRLYRRNELAALIEQFGMPQELYMEAQIWDDAVVQPYRRK